MTRMNRRRFLAISASAAALSGQPGHAADFYQWRGVAMGSAASITLDHPEAEQITARMQTEISRLEDIFSLYRPNSALSRLNMQGAIDAPAFELLECLSLARSVHSASRGAFDPTIQALWAVYARTYAKSAAPELENINAALQYVGFDRVELSAEKITLGKGQVLTLNGIAQGFVADRIATLLKAEGLSNILIDTGEIVALGGQSLSADWPVTIKNGPGISLRDRALATSAPLGTVFDQAGMVGHIIDPRDGTASRAPWSQVSVSARNAALADALSTAACLLPNQAVIDEMLASFPGTAIESLMSG